MVVGASLALRRDGKVTHQLITRLSKPPAVRPPSGPVENVGLNGPGPYEFRLPDVPPGRYELCGSVAFQTGPDPASWPDEPFCEPVEITS